MEDNNLKEKVQKNVKEKIAISNIREEFGMQSNRTKKTVYWVLSSCAVFILAFGIIISVNISNSQEKNSDVVGEMNQNKQEENLEIALKINKVNDMTMTSLDADIKEFDINEKCDAIADSIRKFEFINNINIPSEYKLESKHVIYTRKDVDIEEYSLLHDYVFCYRKDEVNDIRIAFSEVEKPLRDCYIDGGDKISKIGDVELIISQYKEMYIVTFSMDGLYFDIETNGITESQLVDLLVSIINKK